MSQNNPDKRVRVVPGVWWTDGMYYMNGWRWNAGNSVLLRRLLNRIQPIPPDWAWNNGDGDADVDPNSEQNCVAAIPPLAIIFRLLDWPKQVVLFLYEWAVRGSACPGRLLP